MSTQFDRDAMAEAARREAIRQSAASLTPEQIAAEYDDKAETQYRWSLACEHCARCGRNPAIVTATVAPTECPRGLCRADGWPHSGWAEPVVATLLAAVETHTTFRPQEQASLRG